MLQAHSHTSFSFSWMRITLTYSTHASSDQTNLRDAACVASVMSARRISTATSEWRSCLCSRLMRISATPARANFSRFTSLTTTPPSSTGWLSTVMARETLATQSPCSACAVRAAMSMSHTAVDPTLSLFSSSLESAVMAMAQARTTSCVSW